MNKYRDMTNEQISLAVVIALGAKEVSPDVYHDGDRYYEFHCLAESFFDPCNNPADAMPIIIENGISIIFDTGCKAWVAGIAYWVDGCEWQVSYEVERMNQYRAAMELFLLMKDAENEKVGGSVEI